IERGRRPSFDNAEEPERARQLFQIFAAELAATGIPVKTGRFREVMTVALENDGPVTFVYGSEAGAEPAPSVLFNASPYLCPTSPNRSKRNGSARGPTRAWPRSTSQSLARSTTCSTCFRTRRVTSTSATAGTTFSATRFTDI